ncbi:Oxysterol-binding protein 1 [Frankliniella fusca]|uniref:Oxysterol-binding protein 1 n=1 Tax=Frankliniella fusca TaxID=407009 RepID=A0AAE1HV25_9NEOP|nr:Oxysterol-binding protein 1 [Frankliniella fusca]
MDQKADPEMKGWLSKWTNYIKGYQRRWFVLSNGFLSYYRNQAEMAHTCRGNISLHGAMIHTEDSCTFVISNGGTQTFHLRAANEVERQRWVTALELAKSNAIRAMESDEEDEIVITDDQSQSQEAELQNILKNLSARLEDLQTCNDLIVKHGTALQRSLSELETIDTATDLPSKFKAVNERATLFRITSATVINACQDYLLLAQSQGRKWQKMLQHERDQRQRLEEVVETLARQHSHLEQAAKDHQTPRTSMPQVSPSDEDEDNEFYDAQSDQSHSENQQNFIIKIPMGHRRTSSAASLGSQVLSHPPPLASLRHSSFSSPVAPLVRSHFQHTSSLDSPCPRHRSECSSPITSDRKLKGNRPLSTSFLSEHFSRLLSDKPNTRHESATFFRPLANMLETSNISREPLQGCSLNLTRRSYKHKRALSDEMRLDHSIFPRPAQVLAENAFRPGLDCAIDKHMRVQVSNPNPKGKKQNKHQLFKM